MDIVDILYRRFELTGEIGVYMLLKEIERVDDGDPENTRAGTQV